MTDNNFGLIVPEEGKFYSFGAYQNIKFIGRGMDLRERKYFVFTHPDSGFTFFCLEKDEWYSTEIQNQIKGKQ